MYCHWNRKRGAAGVYVLSRSASLTAELAHHIPRARKGQAPPEFYHDRDDFTLQVEGPAEGMRFPAGSSVFTVDGRSVEISDEGTFAAGEPGAIGFDEAATAAESDTVAKLAKKLEELEAALKKATAAPAPAAKP